MSEKNLEMERLVFFSDAIIAIAITLLALDLKVEKTTSGHFHFSDLLEAKHKFAAFILSFFIIAAFWKVHHEFFHYIKRIDNRILWNNIGWLLFIVMLPFSASLVSDYFYDNAPHFIYATNVLMITIFQNNIWDYASSKALHVKEDTQKEIIRYYRIACNIAMVNALFAMLLSLFYPVAAFFILLIRLPMILLANRFLKQRQRPLPKR